MNQSSDVSLLETLARDTQAPMEQVVALYQRERAALSQDATIPNYITLIAMRRVRQQLLHTERHH